MMNKISIIIPAYNSARTIENCLESITKQSYENWEVIVIDDGSSDNTYDIVNEWTQKDLRIRVYTKKNGGVSEARNRGINYVTGDYMMFLDSDDELIDNSLSHACSIIENNCDILVSGYRCKIEREVLNQYDVIATIEEGIYSKQEYEKIFWNIYHTNLFHNIGTKIYKTELVKQNQVKFEKRYSFQEDILFCLNVLKYADNIYITKEVYYLYHLDTDKSLSKRYHRDYLMATKELYFCIGELVCEESDKFFNSYAGSLLSVIMNELRSNVDKFKNFKKCATEICEEKELKDILMRAQLKDKKRRKIMEHILRDNYIRAYILAYSIYMQDVMESSKVYHTCFTFLYKIYKRIKFERIK